MAWHKLLIEMGMGVDHMGKAPRMLAKKPFLDAVHRVCMPSLVEGGLLSSCKVKLTIDLGVPGAGTVDISKVREALPLNMEADIVVQEGGLKTKGVAMEELQDKSDDMFIAVASITVWVSCDSSEEA